MSMAIESNRLLAVEGDDEVNFFNALFKHLSIKNVHVEDVGGKDQFKDKFPALVKRSGFSDITTLAIVRDADTNPDGAFTSIRNIMAKLELTPPARMNTFANGNPKAGIFIMPGNLETGMLEDLCLKTVENDPIIPCVNTFMECCGAAVEYSMNSPAKRCAMAYLAAKPKIVNSVGLGALKGYWNFDSEVLTDLKTFLSHFNTQQK